MSTPALPLVHVFADESCLGNQNVGRARPGGAGGLVEHPHARHGLVRRDFWLSEPDTTNNRMALHSALLPLRALRGPTRVVFVSDSRYLVDGMSRWVHDWARRGWKRKSGAIENVELWRELVEAARPHRVEWRWVKGHALHPRNEYANHLATRAAARQDASGGLVESGFGAWLEQERGKGRYAGFDPSVADAG